MTEQHIQNRDAFVDASFVVEIYETLQKRALLGPERKLSPDIMQQYALAKSELVDARHAVQQELESTPGTHRAGRIYRVAPGYIDADVWFIEYCPTGFDPRLQFVASLFNPRMFVRSDTTPSKEFRIITPQEEYEIIVPEKQDLMVQSVTPQREQIRPTYRIPVTSEPVLIDSRG